MQTKHKSALAEMVREPRTMRRRSGKTQIQFWRGYGVTQSGGSRFERNDMINGTIEQYRVTV